MPAKTMTGAFVSLEGIDGCGKSTQAKLLVDRLTSAGLDVVSLREPGGTPISEKVRCLLLDPANAEMSDECELLLYEAARAQLVREVIEPALARGAVVVCDRFYDSTTAYQGAARGLSPEVVEQANRLGSCGTCPTRTLVLDLDPAEAFSRATVDGKDRLEGEGLAFQRRVREGFRASSRREPTRMRVVDAAGTVDDVAARIDAVLADLIPSLSASDGGEPADAR
ncbi:MAG: dTMP kinase [Atopobiaceae bacterium]|nr:dTMP kinase [Atopobiaceae bacterium]MCH4180224.1 dTMP kinase [Atopobiaceae bacterium]MCH4214394.1 dTMP kinase [Atopobiaceae bacterium]MCH4229175.1 dTMP kinase [Atopobiaceae bacterium]MCH4276546.1 dTMP kinase [Atopobiaceae bacterium]